MGLSTHVLDTSLGRPAAGVPLLLRQQRDGVWSDIGEGITDADGRCRTLLAGHTLEASLYSLRFETEVYFERQGSPGLYPFVEIAFAVREPEQHYHVPLLLSPNGYTTYRGS